MADEFFETRRAAALFKHAILNQYVPPFVMKTGLNSTGHRVVVVDGFAGEGRYEDGSDGSPALLMSIARDIASQRSVECVFVEKAAKNYVSLCDVVNEEKGDLVVDTHRGEVEEHLEAILDRADGLPLFVFLDPFGLAPPMEAVTGILERPRGYGTPATEILINFSAVGLRRIAGHLYSDTPNASTLERMDRTCGGDWWRGAWLEHVQSRDADDEAKREAEAAVTSGYLSKISKAAGGVNWWKVPVKNAAHHRPVYYLCFITRHPDGSTLFGESVSLGMEKWRRALFDQETAGELFTGDEEFKSREKALADEWVDEIERNLRRLLGERKSVRMSKSSSDVYGDVLGLAREKHLRTAWKRLFEDGTTTTDPKGKLMTKTLERA